MRISPTFLLIAARSLRTRAARVGGRTTHIGLVVLVNTQGHTAFITNLDKALALALALTTADSEVATTPRAAQVTATFGVTGSLVSVADRWPKAEERHVLFQFCTTASTFEVSYLLALAAALALAATLGRGGAGGGRYSKHRLRARRVLRDQRI